MASSRAFWARRLTGRLATMFVLAGGAPISASGPTDSQQSGSDRLRYGPGIANHPVRVTPSEAIRIPQMWPLSADGAITCLTCHSKLPSLEENGPADLRDFDEGSDAAVDFCAKCHAAGDNRSAAGMHWQAVRVAHIKPETDVSRDSDALLDVESRRCLGCHDSINATESTNPSAARTRLFEDLRRNHPIGVPYSDRARRKLGTTLRPRQLLPERIRLPGGKVSCISCHNLYQRTEHRLSVPIEESELCFTCHRRK